MSAKAKRFSPIPPDGDFHHQLLRAFREAGWKAEANVPVGDRRADLLVRKGDHRTPSN